MVNECRLPPAQITVGDASEMPKWPNSDPSNYLVASLQTINNIRNTVDDPELRHQLLGCLLREGATGAIENAPEEAGLGAQAMSLYNNMWDHREMSDADLTAAVEALWNELPSMPAETRQALANRIGNLTLADGTRVADILADPSSEIDVMQAERSPSRQNRKSNVRPIPASLQQPTAAGALPNRRKTYWILRF